MLHNISHCLTFCEYGPESLSTKSVSLVFQSDLDGVRVQRKLGSVTTSALYHCLKVDKFPHSCCAVINLGGNENIY